jgi:hypothetical protein
VIEQTPLPDGWHELRPMTFYETALFALRQKFKKVKAQPPSTPEISGRNDGDI